MQHPPHSTRSRKGRPPEAKSGRASPESQPRTSARVFIHQTLRAPGIQGQKRDPLAGLCPGLEDPCVRQKTISRSPRPPAFPPSLSLPPRLFLSFVAGRAPGACLCSAASRKGLVQAEHAGFGEQSRVWFQHLIQFVLPRLKYEMVASQTFKGRRRESERRLKFKF